MKETKREETTSETIYHCEVCGKSSGYKHKIESCEKQHKCEHKNLVYGFIDASDEAYWFNVSGIELQCKDCGKEMGEVDLEDVEENQEVLEKIFNLLKING